MKRKIPAWRNRSLENLKCQIDGIKYVEKWKAIFGFRGRYMISTFGRVMSLVDNFLRGRRFILKQRLDKDGYCKVTLSKKGPHKILSVHRAVTIAFIPNPKNKNQSNHIKGIKTDNRVAMLNWATAKENQVHSREVLKNKCGNYKLSDSQVREIAASKLSPKQLSKKYGICITSISGILNGRHWSKVTKREYVKKEKKTVTKEIAKKIFKSTLKGVELAKKYNITAVTVCEIRKGRTWSSVTGKYYKNVR